MSTPTAGDFIRRDLENQKELVTRLAAQNAALMRQQSAQDDRNERMRKRGQYSVLRKSHIVGLLLAGFFGPIGLLYSSVGWAIVMGLFWLVALPATGGLAAFFLWPLTLVLAMMTVASHNGRLKATL